MVDFPEPFGPPMIVRTGLFGTSTTTGRNSHNCAVCLQSLATAIRVFPNHVSAVGRFCVGDRRASGSRFCTNLITDTTNRLRPTGILFEDNHGLPSIVEPP